MRNQVSLKIDGMDCPSCTSKIEGAVCALPGVSNVSLNYTNQRLNLDLDETAADQGTVTRIIEKLGYKVSQFDAQDKTVNEAWWQTGKGRLLLLTGMLLALASLLAYLLPAFSVWVFSAAALIALYPIARKSIAGVFAGQPFSIETLVTLAVIGAIIIGEAAEAAVVVFLFLVGELLEMLAAVKARRSVQALGDLVPATAWLVDSSVVSEVAANTLKVGDVVEVRPGQRIPADGEILFGESFVDESSITGESIPRHKQTGDDVYAGSINTDGRIRITINKPAEDSTIARIVQMVEDAQASKSPTARFIDRFSYYYTPAVILVALLVAIVPPLFADAQWLDWIYKALTILLIGCPCALVLSTPAAIASGISTGARHGLLMKGGAVLEAIGSVSHIAFDKTGTLTRGQPEVTDVVHCIDSKIDFLALSAAVETTSIHPLAKAIVTHANDSGTDIPEATDAKALSGRGVQAMINRKRVVIASPGYAKQLSKLTTGQSDAIDTLESQGKTVVVTLVDDQIAGLIALRDELRSDAIAAIQELRQLKVSSIMLTGDNERTGSALAEKLGIKVKAQLLPHDKLIAIEELKKNGSIAMLGDGINDAPALARADVGIAMGGGTDVALETADAAILHERVRDVPALIRLSRATMTNIHQNISIALGLKALFLVTTLLGITSLWMAILADTGATVLVTVNALRLLRYRVFSPLRTMAVSSGD